MLLVSGFISLLTKYYLLFIVMSIVICVTYFLYNIKPNMKVVVKEKVKEPIPTTPEQTVSTQVIQTLPSYDLLNKYKVEKIDDNIINAKAKIIISTLKDFGLPLKVINSTKNTAIIKLFFKFDDTVETKTKPTVKAIKRYIEELKVKLGTNKLTFYPVVEGTNTFAFELAIGTQILGLQNILLSNEMQSYLKNIAVKNKKYIFYNGLPVTLGETSTGEPLLFDIKSAPHTLICGETGSGKSVCIHTILTSLLLEHSPKTLQLYLVDGKRTELTVYRQTPHLKHNIIYELGDTLKMLNEVHTEVKKRLDLLTESGKQNITEYNKSFPAKALPYIVVVIDEFGDIVLQQTAAEKREQTFDNVISRIAAMSRAAGVHLILSTQRPDVNIVTPLLKANIPARICFKVVDQTNSRIVIDENGAEKLSGKGDGLLKTNSLTRFKGAFIDLEEIERVVTWWKNNKDN